jgi:DNA primase
MKYLENICLEQLSNELSEYELGGGLKLSGRIEVYSTKKSVDEKKYSKMLESKFVNPDVSEEVGDKKFRKLLIDLIQTLNAAQIYHDFSQLTAEAFTQITLNTAIQRINSSLAEITIRKQDFINRLWKEIDSAFNHELNKCEVLLLQLGVSFSFSLCFAGLQFS